MSFVNLLNRLVGRPSQAMTPIVPEAVLAPIVTVEPPVLVEPEPPAEVYGPPMHWTCVKGLPVRTLKTICKRAGREPTVEQAIELAAEIKAIDEFYRPQVLELPGWRVMVRVGDCFYGVDERGTPRMLDTKHHRSNRNGASRSTTPLMAPLPSSPPPLPNLVPSEMPVWDDAATLIASAYRLNIEVIPAGKPALTIGDAVVAWTLRTLSDGDVTWADGLRICGYDPHSDAELYTTDEGRWLTNLVEKSIDSSRMAIRRRWWRPYVNLLRAALDQEAVAACHKVGRYNGFYEWFNALDDEVRVRRFQSLHAMPFFSPLFYSECLGGLGEEAWGLSQALTEAIDAAYQVLPVFKANGISAASFKRLRAIPPKRLGGATREVLFALAARFPADRLPTDAYQLKMAAALSHNQRIDLWLSSGRTLAEFADFIGCNSRLSANGVLTQLTSAIRNISDMWRYVQTVAIEAPLALVPGGRNHDRLPNDVLGLKPWPSLRASITWHAEQTRLDAFIHTIAAQVAARHDAPVAPDLTCWEPLFEGEVTAANGCHLSCLTTPEALREEGTAMRHCVGGYTSTCLYEGSHIVSIRDAAGKRLSTVEYRIVRNDAEGNDNPSAAPSLHIVQNQAIGDTVPEKSAQDAAEWLRTAMVTGTVKVDADAIDEHQNARRAARPPANCYNRVEHLLGFIPEVPDDLLPILQVVRNALPRDCRAPFNWAIELLEGRMSVADFLARHGVAFLPAPVAPPMHEDDEMFGDDDEMFVEAA